MKEASLFFSWWKYERAPLGLALRWIASEGDTIDPFAMIEQDATAPNGVCKIHNISADGSVDEVSYGMSPELADKWDDAIGELMQAVRHRKILVYGLKKGDDTVSQLSIDLFDESVIDIISPIARDSEIFQSIIDPKHLSLEFGDYDKWPQCDGDILKRDGETHWTRLTARVDDIINIRSYADVVSTWSKQGVRRHGRRPAIDWAMVDDEVCRLMIHHGDFSDDDPNWNCQAKLETEITNFIERTFGEGAVKSESTIRSHVVQALAKYIASKAGK
jgi:hypothetical protein